MGEVHRGRDYKLKRAVAIKFLRMSFHATPCPVSRFLRRPKSSHRSIPTLQRFTTSRKPLRRGFLVLELVEDEMLAERIQGRAIPVEEAVDIATHMCEALETAHEWALFVVI
jgi:serine/threonine protein kinase